MSFDLKGNWETRGFVLPNASKQDVLTVDPGFWYEIAYVTITAGTGTPGSNAILAWFDSSAGQEYVLNDQMQIAAGAPGEWQGFPMNLEAGDKLRVTGATNYHVIFTFHRGSRQANAAAARG